MADHRWAMVVVVGLVDTDAERLAREEIFGRLDQLPRLVESGKTRAVRVLCEDCRVSWEDVHFDESKPWPCPGERPQAIGGPMKPPPERLPRQQRRKAQREALKGRGTPPKAKINLLPRGVVRTRDGECTDAAH